MISQKSFAKARINVNVSELFCWKIW